MKSFTVFRGQGLAKADVDRMINIQGGLLSCNNFLSTSMDRHVSLAFARQTMETSDLVGILFVIKIDPSTSSTPFADIHDVSCFKREKEILFSMNSIFRIGSIKQIDENNRLWQVDLTLTTDNDSDLYALTKQMRKEIDPYATGWNRLGHLLIKLGQFNIAQEIYDILLDQATTDSEKSLMNHMLGIVKDGQGEYKDAIDYFKKSIEMKQNICSPTDSNLTASYNNIGLVYDNMGDYSNALSSHQKALKIYQKTLSSNHPDLAASYNNIGSVYDSMGDYSNALSSHEKALEIRQKALPSNHPDLAISYGHIATVYNGMGDYSKALSFAEKSLAIVQKSLPPTHPLFKRMIEIVDYIKKM
ncbi:unnamed protein product [Rotaria sordida]|uniref:Uncharacterized protein n=1 Tax=Rotaria sordida TaxID=392033 RepID=A0A814E4M1_9BILA|nr:unnamed protein product [Rotaria sordida]